jgi:large subunit ribosomal protein L25
LSNQVTLAAQPRPKQGKGSSGRLRREGRVPIILYGHGVEPVALSVNGRELYRAMHTPAGRNALVRIEVEGTTHLTVARDVQMDPARGEVLHVDFVAVDRDVRISADVPVHLVDQDQMQRDGGQVAQSLHAITILVPPLSMPDSIEVSLAGKGIGDRIRVEDLVALLPEGAELTGDLQDAIVTIDGPAGAAEDAAEAAAAEAGASAEDAGSSAG